MLTIICGDDTAASRLYFSQIKESLSKSDIQIINVGFDDLITLPQQLAESSSLFFNKTAFFSENIDKSINRLQKKSLAVIKILESVAISKEIDLYVWEEKSAWELKIKKIGSVKEFKPDYNIFQLTSACYPKNLSEFFNLLQTVANNHDGQFIFLMLLRQIKLLIQVKTNAIANLPPWQKGKLLSQSKHWSFESLIKFYDGLHRLDVGQKTNNNPQSIIGSLELMACYFLK